MSRKQKVLSVFALAVACCLGVAAQGGPFADDPVIAGLTPVRAVHLMELRTRINAVRTASGMPAVAFTDPVLTAGATAVRAVHITELRTAITEVYQALGRPLPVFTDAIQSGSTIVRAVHVIELRAAVAAVEGGSGGPTDGEDLQLSSAIVSLGGVDDRAFNPLFATVRLSIANGQFSVDPAHLRVFRDGAPVDPALVRIEPAAITVDGVVFDGPNEINLLARDASGDFIDFSTTVWGGSAELRGVVADENGAPVPGAVVSARLAADRGVGVEQTASAAGEFVFTSVPQWSVLLETAAGGRHGSLTVRGSAPPPVVLRATAIGAASPIDNNDFSMGSSGWDLGDAADQVEIVAHEEGTAPPGVAAAETDFDLKLTTGGVEGPRSISRTFNTRPGITSVKVRYRFVTSEVPGGFFGTEFDDAFSVSVRSKTGGGTISESASMNSLGLGAFDAQGATAWRETKLPVDLSGDVVRVDVSVANVADDLLDSYVVIDAVSETNLSLSDVELEDIDRSPLKFLSVASPNPYFGGKTRIYGTLSLEGTADDLPVTISLDIIQGGKRVAVAAFVGPPLPAAPDIDWEFDGLLFELSEAEAARIDVSEDGTVLLVARAQGSRGASIFPVGKVTLLSRYTAGNRFGDRKASLGGDDWAQPGMLALTSHPGFASYRFGDFSNMNGGKFPPHGGHDTGDEVDGWFPGYEARNAATAAAIVAQLNDPLYGSRIARVLVTFQRVSSDPFWTAISNVVLADGRRASDVILPAPGYETRFHWKRVTKPEEPGNQPDVSAAAVARRARTR